MKHFIVAPLSFVLTLAPLAAQTYYNAALQRPVTVIYANNDPTLISPSYANPSKLVDGIISFSSIFEIVAGNVGTRIIIDLGDTPTITRATLNSPTNLFRIRGCEVRTSADSIAWTSWFTVTTNDTNVIDLLGESRSFRWFELHITKTDSVMSTVISEIALTAVIDRPYVTSITVGAALQTLPHFRPIRWSTLFWDSTRTVRIEAGPFPGQLVLLDSAAANYGSYNWNTAILPDSLYVVRVTPNGDRALGASTSVQIRNFGQLSATLGLWPPSIAATYFPPTFIHGLGDTLAFHWTLTPQHNLSYQQHLEYSPDSGYTWLSLPPVSTIDERSDVVAVDSLPPSGYHAFARHVVTLNGQRMVSTMVDHAFQVASIPPGTHIDWLLEARHDYPNFEIVPSIGGGPLSVPFGDDGISILSNRVTMFLGTGDILGDTFGDLPAEFPIAAADLDDDGTMEFVSAAYDTTWGIGAGVFRLYPDSCVRVAFLPTNNAVNSATIGDIDGDDSLDILLSTFGGPMVFHRDGTLMRRFSGSQAMRSILANLTSSPGLEIVGVGSSIMAWEADGDTVPGFPVSSSATSPRIVPFDADADGLDEILFCNGGQATCVDAQTPWNHSFSFSLGEEIVSTPVVVDLNTDGKLEAIIASRKRTFLPWQSAFVDSLSITCIDGQGNSLSGWPRSFPYWRQFTTYKYYGSFGIIPHLSDFAAGPSHVLVASIDGDQVPEVIYSSPDGYMNVLNADGTSRAGFPVIVGTRTQETPIVGDFDHDGALNLLYRVLQEHPARTTFVNVEFPPGSYNPLAIPWPMYMANAQRTGKGNPTVPVGVRDDETPRIPTVFSLAPNYPNPFNPSTTIEYSLPRAVHVSVRVFNLLGQCVATLVDGVQTAGTHRSLFTAEDVPSGVYIVSVAAGSDRASHKILLMK